MVTYIMKKMYLFELMRAIKHLKSLNNSIIFSQVRFGKYTLLDYRRMYFLYELGKKTATLNGDIVECGSYNGGSAAILAKASNKTIWLFDSFEGLPTPSIEDGENTINRFYYGWDKGDIDKVHQVFKLLKIKYEKYKIIKGWFHETFPNTKIDNISLLHIDADWYNSVMLSLEKFFDSVVTNGYIVLDDYGHWEGCRKATDEFICRRNLKVEFQMIDDDACFFRKS